MRKSELLAKGCFEKLTGRELQPAVPDNDVPDLRTSGPPMIAVEVKEVTVEETRRLIEAWRRVSYFESSVLSKWWTVALMVPMLDDLLPQSSYQPRPTVTEECRSALAAEGLIVVDDVPPTTPAILHAPDPRRLCQRLEPLLSQLEEREVRCTRGSHRDIDSWRVVFQVERLTNGGIAMAHEPLTHSGRPAGIELAVSSGAPATGDANRFLARVEEFMHGARGESLRLQLAACGSYAERHAFLVLDSTEPEWWTSHDWGESVVPSRPPVLPPMITAIWIALGHLCWCWHPERGWLASTITEAKS